MNESIESNTTLEVNCDEVSIHLLINIKYKVTVVDTVYPILNMPHSTSLLFCETNVRYYQYNTETYIVHYF